MAKDNFSTQADQYVKFRPHYPPALYSYLFDKVGAYETAWDCGTGNGQVAQQLAGKFKKVFATDISQKQLNNAFQSSNIEYRLAPAESSTLPDKSVDIITVAQAIHWFNFEQFFEEVKRVSKPQAILSYWAYGLLNINENIDPLIREFHDVTLGNYWDPERGIWEREYSDVNFSLSELEKKCFSYDVSWSLDQLSGYLNTWSSVQKYIKTNNQNPVEPLIKTLQNLWSGGLVTFPIFLFSGTVR